ncbi:hypothetical protein PFMG_03212 [Plasmodium falciparum IGH-CR14]|uniref:Uncharacterized protein n=1 Tax=Plasmodium falciparum IGH-CR14 TaxID=580059 RepID=A0A0L1IC22_PLAFA|nr:hypothetical protein PFMG_03212 [Plasmodium falciparum IGH-CR14]
MSHIYDMPGINVEKIKTKKKQKEKISKKQLNFLKEKDNLFSVNNKNGKRGGDLITKLPEEDKEDKNIYSARYYFQKLKIDISYFDKLDIYLKENNIEKPTIYTENICFLYGVLRTDVAILLNLRKKIEKLKQEREFWKGQMNNLEEEYLKKQQKT